MTTATVTEAKNRLSALLAQVRAGETVLIVDRGRPVARLEPVASLSTDMDGRLARLERVGAVRPARAEVDVARLLETPPSAEPGASAVEALLAERSSGR